MDRVPVRHAAELIQDTPGVASAVNRQNPGLSINIRGMQDFGRVNMMIDGMRQDFVQNGHMQRNGEMYVDSELLSEVEVERGVVRGVHGTGAMAGSVDFRTLDFGDVLREGRDIGLKLRGTSGMGYQGNGVNFIGSAAGAARAGENLEVLAAVSRRSIGDYRFGLRGGQFDWNKEVVRDSDGGRSKVEFNDVKFAAQEQDSSLFKVRWKLNDASSLQLSYVGTRVNYSYTAESVLASPDKSGSPWRKLGVSKAQSDSFALDYKLKPADNPWLDLNVKLYAVDTRVSNYTEPNYPKVLTPGGGSWITDPVAIREAIHFEHWKSDGTGKCETDNGGTSPITRRTFAATTASVRKPVCAPGPMACRWTIPRASCWVRTRCSVPTTVSSISLIVQLRANAGITRGVESGLLARMVRTPQPERTPQHGKHLRRVEAGRRFLYGLSGFAL
ncbi:TonB-dependent receptor plug domain-containing protein [Achromobacter xylosoxidans]